VVQSYRRGLGIASIIARELKHVALSGVNGPETKLAFSGFIMGLVLAHHVHIPGPAHEELTHPIDDAFNDNLEKKEQKELRASSSRASSSRAPPPANEPHPAPPPTKAFDFSYFIPWMT